MRRLRLTFCLLVAASALHGQIPEGSDAEPVPGEVIVIGGGHTHPDDPTMGGYQGVDLQPIAGQIDNDALPADPHEHEADSVKTRVRRPLESYFFDDSVRTQRNFVWTPDLAYNRVEISAVDTALHDLQSDYPFLQGRGDVGAVYLGNLGAASMPLDFAARSAARDFSFARAWQAYRLTPENVPFYNVKQPFTQLTYMQAGQKKYAEDHFRATHAQNITPSTGFAIDYRSLGTQGIYAHQKARQKNLSTNIYHAGRKYTLHAGYLFNRFEAEENGGIEDDFWITDTLLELTENLPVRLRDARTRADDNTFFLVHSYGVPLRRLTEADYSIADRTSLFIGQSTRWTRYKKRYTDTRARSGGDNNPFYAEWLGDPDVTLDSLSETLLSSRVFIQLQPWGREAAVGLLDAGVGMDIHRYHGMRRELIAGAGDDEAGFSLRGQAAREEDYYLYGALSGALSRYASWGADMRLSPAGDRSGDVEMGAHLTLNAWWRQRPVTLEVRARSTRLLPAYWDRHYLSNHFAWDNDFAREKRTRLEADLRIPHLGVELNLDQQLVTDMVYYDSLAMPAQAGGVVSVTGLRASKLFKLGVFRMDYRVLMQWSSDERVVPLPAFSAFAAWYLDLEAVREVLHLQIGLDGRYNTSYHAPGYMPATAQFYNQRAGKTGGYPLLDAFVAAKWKRMRIFVKMEHVNDDMLGFKRKYFSAAHYPLNKRVFKVGISWGFYD